MRFRKSSKSYKNPLFNDAVPGSWILRHRWMVLFIIVVGASGLIYLAYGLPALRLTTLEVAGQYTLPLESLRSLTREQMRSRWLLFFKQSNLMAFDPNAYEKRLREKWIFSNVDIKRKLPNTIQIKIIEESPAYTFSHPSGLFSVDRTGTVSTVLAAPLEKTPSLNLPVVPEKINLGQSILTPNDANFIWEFLSKLNERGNQSFTIASISLNQAPDSTVRFKTIGDWDIVTDRLGDTQSQVQAFFMSYDQKLKGKKFEYVDVSVPSRVYVK